MFRFYLGKEHMTNNSLNDYVRAAVIVLTLAAVVYLAIQQTVPQIALVAAGALVATLNQATGYEFRGRVQTAADDEVVIPPPTKPPTT